jgi:hypothetical protein
MVPGYCNNSQKALNYAVNKTPNYEKSSTENF